MKNGTIISVPKSEKENLFQVCDEHGIFWEGAEKTNSFEITVKEKYFPIIESLCNIRYAVKVVNRDNYARLTILNDNANILRRPVGSEYIITPTGLKNIGTLQ